MVNNKMTETEWNPLYAAYASKNGKTPEEMMESDTLKYPGGRMTGFILWISELKEQFRKENRKSFIGDSIWDIQTWTQFVKEKAGENT